MRRALYAIGGLAASTTLLVAVKGVPAATPAGQDLAAGQAGAPQAEPSATPSGKPATRRSKDPAGKTPAKTPTARPPAGKFQVTGPVVSNEHGDVQVRVTMSGTKLLKVDALKMPASSARSEQLSPRVAREMAAEAIREQSADDLDTVSGASSTSASYRESLQAALDKAARGERD